MPTLIKKTLFFITTLCVLAIPLLASAAGELPPYKLLADGIPYISTVPINQGLAGYLSAFFKLGLGIAVTLAILLFVYNGVLYMTSDATGKKAEAIGAFQNIIWGLVIVFAAVMVLTQINPQLTNFGLFTSLEKAKMCIQNPWAGGCTSATTPPPTSGTAPDGVFIFDNAPYNDSTTPPTGGDIAKQMVHASPQLSNLLTCMSQKVPGNVGRISSISDNIFFAPGSTKTFQQCAYPDDGKESRKGCVHRAGSQHYGGISANCIGKSYAVDFGDEENKDALRQAAVACGGNGVGVADEGDHLHISIGTAAGCAGGL